MIYDEFKRKSVEGSETSDSDLRLNNADSSAEVDSLQWARDAYARLKKQQEEDKKLVTNISNAEGFSSSNDFKKEKFPKHHQ